MSVFVGELPTPGYLKRGNDECRDFQREPETRWTKRYLGSLLTIRALNRILLLLLLKDISAFQLSG